jgi:phosphoribosyl 1,2-cyclic phosphate phosphodiesterase
MKIRLLGTGDAIGTPKIGCTCEQCASAHDSGLMRLRTSLLIETRGRSILIDTSPDLRQQLLACGSPHIDAVFWTHGHYDHFMGFGEFYRVQSMPPVHAPPPVMEYCGRIFSFLPFRSHEQEPFRPFRLFGLEITFIEVNHPPAYTCGLVVRDGDYRVGYTSDTRCDIPQESRDLLRNVDLLFIDALVPAGYHIPKHMNYPEACHLAAELGAREFRCVHMSHIMPWTLPNLGMDGECFELGPDARRPGS